MPIQAIQLTSCCIKFYEILIFHLNLMDYSLHVRNYNEADWNIMQIGY